MARSTDDLPTDIRLTSSDSCAYLSVHLQPSRDAEHANKPQQLQAGGCGQGQPRLDVTSYSTA